MNLLYWNNNISNKVISYVNKKTDPDKILSNFAVSKHPPVDPSNKSS